MTQARPGARALHILSMTCLASLALATMALLPGSGRVFAQDAPSAGPQTKLLQQLPADASLLEAWLLVEQRFQPQWAYAFIQSAWPPPDAPSLTRLSAELESAAHEARQNGQRALARGMLAWRDRARTLDQPRLPGRVDPAWLMNNLRHVPPVRELSALGWCQPPAWVEAWHPWGVSRVPWHPDMTTATLLNALPDTGLKDADRAQVVTPLGEVQPLGIAPWNYQRAPLAPGSRVILELPLKTLSTRWLATALPRFLATRLPGDDCLRLPFAMPTPTAASPAHDSTP